jgi:thiol-disulfide isomerase/thioredoxin
MAVRFAVLLLFAAMAWAQRCDPPAPLDDFWRNRLLLDGRVYEKSAIREKYRARFEADPSLENQYLYARSLVGFDTKEALRVYAEILAKDSDNPWVHYSQLEIYRSPAFRDRAKLRASFDVVTRACPAWVEPYRYLGDLGDDSPAARLRTLLDKSTDQRELRLYPTVWAAEFRLKAAGEKERVNEDLNRLRGTEGTQATIAAGAKLIGDEPLAKEMTPPHPFDIFEAERAWREAHPYPKSGDPPEKKQEYAHAALDASAEWIAKAPLRIGGYSQRLSALEMLDAPRDEIANAAEEVIRVARADDRAGGATYIANIAREYVTRGILLDHVPALIVEVLKTFDDPEDVFEVDLAPNHERTVEARMRNASWHVASLVTLSQYYEKVGQIGKARSVLVPVPSFLAGLQVPEGTRDENLGHNILSWHAMAYRDYWDRMAKIDERVNRKEEALNDYREELIHWDYVRDKLLAEQRRLWKELGRSDEAWQAWVDAIPRPAWRQPGPPPAEFGAVHRALPKTALKDLDGNEWPVERFAKTTIAVVWATWCTPCRSELPHFAKLAERLKDRTDVQVISFDTDDNPETAKQFMQENGYRFPALAAKNFAEELMPYFSIPRTWIIRNGEIVEEAHGFAGDGDGWVERVAARVKD